MPPRMQLHSHKLYPMTIHDHYILHLPAVCLPGYHGIGCAQCAANKYGAGTITPVPTIDKCSSCPTLATSAAGSVGLTGCCEYGLSRPMFKRIYSHPCSDQIYQLHGKQILCMVSCVASGYQRASNTDVMRGT